MLVEVGLGPEGSATVVGRGSCRRSGGRTSQGGGGAGKDCVEMCEKLLPVTGRGEPLRLAAQGSRVERSVHSLEAEHGVDQALERLLVEPQPGRLVAGLGRN